MMTVGEWVAQIQPAPPAALHRRLQDLVAAHAERPAADVPDVCLEAGERLLDELLQSGSTSRETALDLLAVDSLVTYAFQAAADDPSRIEERAAAAMLRIAALPAAISNRQPYP
ncbi:MAG: hypothetical protein IBJ03_12845 [Gemmatimonadaceae bacterium]|nr:hypothetical protein [Gemmatimonadaceae bacterium]